MDLLVLERILLLQILPDAGDFATLKIVRDLQSELSFSEEETAVYKIVSDNGTITWDASEARPKDVPIGPKAHLLIADKLKALSDNGELTMNQMGIYEKFVDSS